jgi:hypothetical protein
LGTNPVYPPPFTGLPSVPQDNLWHWRDEYVKEVTIPKRANVAGVIYVKDGKIMFAEHSSDDGVVKYDMPIESWYDLHKAVTKSLLRR